MNASILGARCGTGHELEIVSEGYGLCSGDVKYCMGWAEPSPRWWCAWRFTRPMPGIRLYWLSHDVTGRDGTPIAAWVSEPFDSKEDALDFINADIEAHRALPFDEERERARLMAV